MFFNILQKDIKRKKTMNLILLVFIIMTTTFIASSVNNLAAITTAMEVYLEKAGVSDYVVLTMKEEENDRVLEAFLEDTGNAESWTKDEILYFNGDNIKLSNGGKFSSQSAGIISRADIRQQKFFDSRDQEITQMKEGEIYLPLKVMRENKLSPGDRITILAGSFHREFLIVDYCKDAFMGSAMMGTFRILLSEGDYGEMKAGTDFTRGVIYSVSTQDIKVFKQDFTQKGFQVIASGDKALIRNTYVMDMVISGILLVVSVCLILISLVILRFTIVFTLNEEFREIGIMKAIGLKSRKIRGIYIVKYLAISIVGAVIGFFMSIPFGAMFIKQISENIMISQESAMLGINLCCALIIVAIVVFFCYSCTNRIKKFSPIAAIRNGSSGERYKRKGLFSLSRGRFPAVWFLAFHEIASEWKKYSMLLITFTMGIILIIVPVNTINTLNSDKIIHWFGMAESDLYLKNPSQLMEFMVNERSYLEEYLARMEETLNQNGIAATVSIEMTFSHKISLENNVSNCISLQGTGVKADQYNAYTKGQPPEYENEIAVTHITAASIGAEIGDTIEVLLGEESKEFIITGIYQSMNNMGEGIRYSEKTVIDYRNAVGGFAFQIKYKDHLTAKEKERKREDIKELFPDFEVYEGREYAGKTIGDISGQLEEIKKLIVLVILVINILVAVLMVKTFIAKEKGEIGMLKCIGFRNSAIVKRQLICIGAVMAVSAILGALLSNPVAQISSGKVFEMMGASRIEFVIKPLETYLVYPLIIFILTMTASSITALQIRKISAREINNID